MPRVGVQTDLPEKVVVSSGAAKGNLRQPLGPPTRVLGGGQYWLPPLAITPLTTIFATILTFTLYYYYLITPGLALARILERNYA